MAHLTDDDLEQLAFALAERTDIAQSGGSPSLRTDRLASIEEHISTCPECAERARETAEFVQAFHDASRALRNEE